MSDPRPPRVRVTGPPRHQRRTPPTHGLDAETPLGSLYVASLLRAQRAAAARALATLALTVGALPLVFFLWPALGRAHLLGVPLPWLLVGIATYPCLMLIGWRHLRRTERIERDFVDLLRRGSEP